MADKFPAMKCVYRLINRGSTLISWMRAVRGSVDLPSFELFKSGGIDDARPTSAASSGTYKFHWGI